jgi:hypothetical protein
MWYGDQLNVDWIRCSYEVTDNKKGTHESATVLPRRLNTCEGTRTRRRSDVTPLRGPSGCARWLFPLRPRMRPPKGASLSSPESTMWTSPGGAVLSDLSSVVEALREPHSLERKLAVLFELAREPGSTAGPPTGFRGYTLLNRFTSVPGRRASVGTGACGRGGGESTDSEDDARLAEAYTPGVRVDALACLERGFAMPAPRRRMKAARGRALGEALLRGDLTSSSEELLVPASSVRLPTVETSEVVLAREDGRHHAGLARGRHRVPTQVNLGHGRDSEEGGRLG